METAKDIVFPSRVLKRQLEDAQHRLKEIEEELETIKNKEQHERKRRKKTRVRQLSNFLSYLHSKCPGFSVFAVERAHENRGLFHAALNIKPHECLGMRLKLTPWIVYTF